MKKLSLTHSMSLFGMMAVLGITFAGCSKNENYYVQPTPTPETVDTKVPSIYIMSPTSEETYVTNESSITLSGTAQDDKALKEIVYASNRGASGVATGLEQWSISNLALQEGDNIVTVKAIDKSNNASKASITITKNRYLIFFGVPVVSNTMLYSDVATESWITVSIAPNERLIAESVRVIEIDEAGAEMGEMCRLYDDGDLTNHGDEIKGDNIFSAKHTFTLSGEGTHRYRVSAKTSESEGEIEGFSSVFTITVVDQSTAEAKIETIMSTQEGIENKVKELAAQSLSTPETEASLRAYLNAQPALEKVEKVGTDLKVTHKSGFVSYIELEANNDTKGGDDVIQRRGGQSIPLNLQTRGVNSFGSHRAAPRFATPTKEESDNFILNKKVLIWAAYEDQFSTDMATTLIPIFKNSPVGFKDQDITHLSNEQCTIQSLENLAEYGIIIFDTHGGGGDLLKTRHKVQYTHEYLWGLAQWGDDNHEELGLLKGEYYIATNKIGNSYYIVTSEFFRTHIKKTLPNSVVFNGSCESLKTEKLSKVFMEKGARTYFGFLESVGSAICAQKADEFFTGLVGSELKTTGESINSMETKFDELDDKGNVRHNALEIRGSRDMHFYLGLINGDFEYGTMNGWNVSGDGRVITALGPQRPTQGKFMGIVSTGLGYTENYGRISQSFYISNETTLSMRWNFLSEEFMEYVGSQYQDYIRVSIVDGGVEHQLMRINVDGFAANYTLSKVSPEIVFDRGDVYMTGWMSSSFDISPYQGKTVTLVIESGDVGDSIYDSATLLDEISVD